MCVTLRNETIAPTTESCLTSLCHLCIRMNHWFTTVTCAVYLQSIFHSKCDTLHTFITCVMYDSFSLSLSLSISLNTNARVPWAFIRRRIMRQTYTRWLHHAREYTHPLLTTVLFISPVLACFTLPCSSDHLFYGHLFLDSLLLGHPVNSGYWPVAPFLGGAIVTRSRCSCK